MHADRDSLIAEISAAFDGVPREDGTTLHEAEELDCHGSSEELLQARQLDTDARWQDVPEEWIENFPEAFYFLDMKGLRYYLPVVMIWSLQHHGSSKCATDDNMEFLLYDTERISALLPLLTARQRRAIALWLLQFAAGVAYQPEREVARFRASPWAGFLDSNQTGKP